MLTRPRRTWVQDLAWRRRAATLILCGTSSEHSMVPVLSWNGRKHLAAAWASWVPQEDASPT